MCTTASLQTLVNISKHEALKTSLKHCIIGLESYEATYLDRIANEAQQEAFRDGLADQFALLNSGRGRDLLATAFRHLPNLQTIGIRDYEAHGRSRDSSRWRSYGAPTVFLETSCNLESGSSQFASKVFLLLMQALSDADRAIPVSSIETILRKRSNGLNDLAFFLSPDAKMERVLNGLQQLLLTVNVYADIHCRSINCTTLMEAFLHRVVSLQHVRLNFQRYDPPLGSPILQRLVLKPNLLPNLRRLDLGMLSVEPAILIQIISKFSTTIRHVSLWKVKLSYDSASRWKEETPENRYHPWPRVLRDLSMVTQLTSMTMGCLSQQGDSNPWSITNLHFSNNDLSRECSGSMEVWLPQVLDELEVEWQQHPQRNDDENSDESEAETDDEDMDGSSNGSELDDDG